MEMHMRPALFLSFAAAAFISFGTVAVSAAPLPKPQGKPILTISGNITNTNDGQVARFDREMLEAVGTTKLTTQTPWYEQIVEFEGVPMKALMEAVGANGTEVTATALNDYVSTIPLADFEEYDVILALKRDGEYMPIRDKGPLFIVYPYDSDPELATDKYYSRSAWQVKELEIQ
jgi:hypothetical protein